jgi:hypothetical protein
MFRSDLSTEPLLTDAALRLEAGTANQERTYTCVPVGSGVRIGVDRDSDGCFDRDETLGGSDPADPLDSACGLSTTTTTTSLPGGTTTTSTTLPTICGSVPAGGCRPAAPGKSSVFLRNHSDNKRDAFRWLWKGGGTALGDFLNPVSGAATYNFCVYDASADPQPLMATTVLPGGTCNGRPCWKTTGSTGFRYKNPAATPNGMTRATLKAGFIAPQAMVSTGGRGVNLPMFPLGLTLPVTVQLVAHQGITTECWQSTYTSASKNDASQFKAKGP